MKEEVILKNHFERQACGPEIVFSISFNTLVCCVEKHANNAILQ